MDLGVRAEEEFLHDFPHRVTSDKSEADFSEVGKFLQEKVDLPNEDIHSSCGLENVVVLSVSLRLGLWQSEPLRTLMNRYRQAQGLGRCKLTFYFDGKRLADSWTPEDLGMERGDIIEVWR